MKAKASILVCLAVATAVFLCLFIYRSSKPSIDNTRWDAIEASHPVIALAQVTTADHTYTHHFLRFIKNEHNLTRESVQKIIARFDGSLKNHESIGKQAIFLIDNSPSPVDSGPSVAGTHYVYDGCITTLSEADNVRIALDYITEGSNREQPDPADSQAAADQ